MLIAEGEEDFLILNSHDGFLQFYGVDDQFIVEVWVNLPDGDFRSYSIINREKKHLLERVSFVTPYGRFTPVERDIVSLEMLKTAVRKYYEKINEDDFLKEVPYVETTEDMKRCKGLIK